MAYSYQLFNRFFWKFTLQAQKVRLPQRKRGSWKALYQVLFKPQTLQEKVIAPSPAFW